MVPLLIDGRPIEVAEGVSVLEAAARLGVRVPTLCHLHGCEPLATCMVCLVEERTSGRLLPACATRAEPGMRIETESDTARLGRRTALELLLSEHAGECVAPCARGCPLGIDVPAVLDCVQMGDLGGAWRRVRDAVALPATAARLCRGACRKACRRRQLDTPLDVPAVHARVAAWGLAHGAHPRLEGRGRRVAVVGGGAAGLAAVDVLVARGHVCTLFDSDAPGARLRADLGRAEPAVRDLEREIADVLRRDVVVRQGVRLGLDVSMASVRREFDMLLVTTGERPAGLEALAPESVLCLEGEGDGAGSPLGALTRGRDLGLAAHARLAGTPVAAPLRFSAVTTEPQRDELLAMAENRRSRLAFGGLAPAADSAAGREAERCLGCGCAAADSCALRRLASAHHAEPRRFAGARKRVLRGVEHRLVRHEPGKCVLCGRCTRLSEQAGEPVGLAVVGRGFATRVEAPLGGSLDAALSRSALACAAACPTGALSTRPQAARPGEPDVRE